MTKIRWKISIPWYSISEKCNWKKFVASIEVHGNSKKRSGSSKYFLSAKLNYIKLKLINQMNLNEDNEADSFQSNLYSN